MSHQKDASTHSLVLVSDRQQSTILAALRHYQEFLRRDEPGVPGLRDIASDGGALIPLSIKEIDDLCEETNFGSDPKAIQAFLAACAKN